MRVCLVLAVVVAALAGQAAAQSTTTNCRPTYAGAPQLGMTCESSGGAARAAAPAPVYSWRDVKPKICSKLEVLASSGNECDARAQAFARKQIGEMMAGGDCDGAIKAALGTGDIAFAGEVRDFCKK